MTLPPRLSQHHSSYFSFDLRDSSAAKPKQMRPPVPSTAAAVVLVSTDTSLRVRILSVNGASARTEGTALVKADAIAIVANIPAFRDVPVFRTFTVSMKYKRISSI
jgi:hypothetical protein